MSRQARLLHRSRPQLTCGAYELGPAPVRVLVPAALGALFRGLRVFEAIGADIEALGVERGQRTLAVTRKGGKVVTVPLVPRTARAIDLAIGERVEGPVFLASNDHRLDRHGAGRIVRRSGALWRRAAHHRKCRMRPLAV